MGLQHLLAIMEVSHAVQHRLLNPPSGNDAPVNVQTPTVYGTKSTGKLLVCLMGTWNGTEPITFTYQWLKDGNPIVGATTYEYTVQAGDVASSLSCRVTATNSEASVNATSPVI